MVLWNTAAVLKQLSKGMLSKSKAFLCGAPVQSRRFHEVLRYAVTVLVQNAQCCPAEQVSFLGRCAKAFYGFGIVARDSTAAQ